MAIQIFLLNSINLRWWGSESGGAPPFVPILYPLIILLLPVSTPTIAMLFLSFFTGLTVDAFMNTGGMHAAACLLMGYSRMFVLTSILPNKLEDLRYDTPSAKYMGFNAFLLYAGILLFIHHILFYIIEIWSLSNFGYLLLKVFGTWITSLIFVIIYVLLFDKKIKITNS